MANKISETHKISVESFLSSTSAAEGTTSGLYDMTGYDQAFLGVNIGIKGTIATISTIWVDLMESSHVTAAPTSACGGKVGIEIGTLNNTVITATAGVRALILKMGDAGGTTCTTTGDLFHIGLGTEIATLTWSTLTANLAATAWTATAAYFGAQGVDATANTGQNLTLNSVRTALQSTRLSFGGPDVFKFSTPDTHTMIVEVINAKAGPFNFSNTVSTKTIVARPSQIAAAFEIRSDQLTSTLNKKYVGLKTSTTAQPANIGFTIIRTKGRYMPSGFIGKMSS